MPEGRRRSSQELQRRRMLFPVKRCPAHQGRARLAHVDRGHSDEVGRMKRLCVCSLAVACLAIAPMTMVGRAAQENRTSPDISGFWELNFDSRKVPQASLLPSVTRARRSMRARRRDALCHPLVQPSRVALPDGSGTAARHPRRGDRGHPGARKFLRAAVSLPEPDHPHQQRHLRPLDQRGLDRALGRRHARGRHGRIPRASAESRPSRAADIERKHRVSSNDTGC